MIDEARSLAYLFYGDRLAKRSKVPLINHLYEGNRILQKLNVAIEVRAAYYLHPLVQEDSCLKENIALLNLFSPEIVTLVMEYRNIANAGLRNNIVGIDENGGVYQKKPIQVSIIPRVNSMLVADKVQNYKDFCLYHKGIHEDSEQLDFYFKAWFRALGISSTINLYLEWCR